MNNPMAGTDPTGYTINGKRRFLVSGDSCMGDTGCEIGQTFNGPLENFRISVEAGSRRDSKAYEKFVATKLEVVPNVQILDLTDLNDMTSLAMNGDGTMSQEDIAELLGQEDSGAGKRRGLKATGPIMDALGDVVEPGPENAAGAVGKVKDLKRVGEALGRSIDEPRKSKKIV